VEVDSDHIGESAVFGHWMGDGVFGGRSGKVYPRTLFGDATRCFRLTLMNGKKIFEVL